MRASASVLAILVAACSDSDVSGEDGDGLARDLELAGWQIRVDRTGHGPEMATTELVTSDPTRADTDGDGLDDLTEYQIRTDPRHADTDGDGLTDKEEWERWSSNPCSVDTDCDCRGPNGDMPPTAALFDGYELAVLGTSPTLADTDGDACTDFEERGSSSRHPLIAEIPQARLLTEGDVDVRLRVQYAESVGGSRQYGSSITHSRTNSERRSHTRSMTHTVGVEAGYSGGSAHVVGKYEFSHSASTTTETSSSTTLQQQHSEYVTDSRNYTETASDGSISLGMRVENIGPSTFRLTNLGVTVLQWMQDDHEPSKGEFRTLATLQPSTSEFTVAPRERTPVLQMSASSVNADVIKHFLAHPHALVFEPAAFDLETAEGIDYRFLTENTLTRTALVEIDFGGGNLEVYRVATNVQRLPDGTPAGVTMKQVMEDILRIPYEVERRASGDLVLASVRGHANGSSESWLVVAPEPLTVPFDFESTSLRAGDEIQLMFVRDADQDGLYEIEEEHFGTDENCVDFDEDDLTDVEEVKIGWIVHVVGQAERRVYSDPRVRDSDEDGDEDDVERDHGTDPNDPDTDGDGLIDSSDPEPTLPASRLHVYRPPQDPPPGAWTSAFSELHEALDRARELNGNADPADDIAQIWVARGVYEPPQGSSFQVVPDVAVYGGFDGTETRLGGREPDPLLGETVLRQPASSTRYVVVAAAPATRTAVLDGFTIRDGVGGVHCNSASPTLRNLMIYNHHTGVQDSGAGVHVRQSSDPGPLLESCLIVRNTAGRSGGGLYLLDSDVEITSCSFAENRTEEHGQLNGGGAIFVEGDCSLVMRDCLVAQNSTSGEVGGGIAFYEFDGDAWIDRCGVLSNTAVSTAGEVGRGGGVGFYSGTGHVVITNGRLWDNAAIWGSAVHMDYELQDSQALVSLVNCSVVGNRTTRDLSGAVARANDCQAGLFVKNSILFENETIGPGKTALAQIYVHIEGDGDLEMSNCCVQYSDPSQIQQNLLPIPGTGNLYSDSSSFPAFAGPFDLRLTDRSPCIDRGSNFVDLDPLTPGVQTLPETDLDGNPRVVDGGSGRPTVDMGAYEYQPPRQ